MAMGEFVSLENLQHCEGRFRSYMEQHHSIAVGGRGEDARKLRQLLYSTMVEVQGRVAASGTHPTLKAMNNATLNAARDAMLSQSHRQQPRPLKAAAPPPPPHQPPDPASTAATMLIEREQDIYGRRQVRFNELVPVSSDRRADVTDRIMESHSRAVGERSGLGLAEGRPTSLPTGEVVVSMDTSEFEQRLADIASGRADDQPLMSAHKPKASAQLGKSHSDDPMAIMEMLGNDADDEPGGSGKPAQQYQQADLLLPSLPTTQLRESVRFLTIDGSDRDYLTFPFRYKFMARTHGLQASSLMRSYQNIVWIEATRIILPMEIVSATGSVVMPKGYYNIEYSFAFPYLVLMLDDFDGTMDGTNELLRRAFCVFVYDRDYKAPNGRGYVLLRPIQAERKAFTTPIGSLRDLSLSLVRPNGVLFNSSRDELTASLVKYEPQNRLMLRVVVDQYFDRNDIWTGDMVRMNSFSAEIIDANSTTPELVAGVNELVAFVNRGEGHQVIQLGATNDQGFINSFYILAPAQLDSVKGSVVVDSAPLAVVAALGAGALDSTARVRVTAPARIINMSLQAVITMRVGCLEAVPSAIRPAQLQGIVSS